MSWLAPLPLGLQLTSHGRFLAQLHPSPGLQWGNATAELGLPPATGTDTGAKGYNRHAWVACRTALRPEEGDGRQRR